MLEKTDVKNLVMDARSENRWLRAIRVGRMKPIRAPLGNGESHLVRIPIAKFGLKAAPRGCHTIQQGRHG